MNTLETVSPLSSRPTVIATQRRAAWVMPLAAAVLAVAAGAGGVLIGRHSATTAEVGTEAPSGAAATQANAAATEAAAPATSATPARPAAPARHERGTAGRTSVGSPATSPTPLATEPARAVAVCAQCGTVESVRTEVQQGQGSGVGAVAGGVVGGLLGNQMGKGSGRTAMTVIGAVGGGLAGNAIEKHQRSRTVYVVKVRMDDGTLRSFTRSEAWAVGQRVTVDGSTLQAGTGNAGAAAAPVQLPRERMVQTLG